MSLSPGEWARVEALFPQLLELRAAERTGFLGRECAGASAVRAELEAMLAASAGGAGLLDARVKLASGRTVSRSSG